MRQIIFASLLSLSVVSVVATQAPGQNATTKLSELSHKTGWVPLGELTGDGKAWSVMVDPDTTAKDGMSGTFEIIGKALDPSLTTLPTIGERIRMRVRVPIFIRDFAQTGEDQRLVAPMSRTHPLRARDIVGWLEAGAVVTVRGVSVIKHPNLAHKYALARVSP